jgi:bacterioferritin
MDAVDVYNRAVKKCVEVGDNASRALFEDLLVDEENHVDWIETQLSAIQQVGLENYLAQKLGEDKE